MVQFIHQEATEKADEIKLKSMEEFNINKLRLVEQEKSKIRAEYEVKEKQVEVQKRMCDADDSNRGEGGGTCASFRDGCPHQMCTPRAPVLKRRGWHLPVPR